METFSEFGAFERREYELRDLLSRFQPTEVGFIDEYQQKTAMTGEFFNGHPVPFDPDNPEWNQRVGILPNNIAIDYGNEVEEFIDNDTLVNDIAQMRNREGSTPNLVQALCARRSVLAMLFTHVQEVPDQSAA